MTPDQLQSFLRDSIPILGAVELRVLHCAPERVLLAAPLAANRNHHQTAFGGSLALLSILAGWSLLHVALEAEQLPAQLVVQNSELAFERPVTGELIAEARRPDQDWPRFLTALRGRGRARIDLTTRIAAGERDGVIHRGRYAAALTSPTFKSPSPA